MHKIAFKQIFQVAHCPSVAAVELSARPHLAQDPTTADVDVVGAVQVGGVVVT